MAEPFPGPIPPAPPIGLVQIVDEEGRATAVFAEWLAKLMLFLTAPEVLRFEEAYDPPALGPATASAIATMAVPGARAGDLVIVSFSGALDGLTISGWVSADDTVSFQLFNPTVAAIDLPAGVVRVRVRGI